MEKYNSKEKLKDHNKRRFNRKIVETLRRLKIRKGKAIVLDNRYLNTTLSLVKAGLKKENVSVPNPYDDYHRIKSKHKNTYKQLLGDYLTEFTDKVTVSIFDYCCSLDGNEKVNPLIDLQTYFENKIPTHNSFLSVTLSWRNKSKQAGTYSDFNRLVSKVTELAHYNGYSALLCPEGHSYKGMYYAFFHIL